MTEGVQQKGSAMDRREIADRFLEASDRIEVLSDNLEDAIKSWVRGDISDGDLKRIAIREIGDCFDPGTEVRVNVSCCCDSFFDIKLEEGFEDDLQIHRYLERDWSCLIDPMIREFSEGFAILRSLDEMGMHDAAMGFATEIADSIDASLARGNYFHDYVIGCLKIISERMRESIGNDSPTAWMARLE